MNYMHFGQKLKRRKTQVTKVLRDPSNPTNQRRQEILVLHFNISEEGVVQRGLHPSRELKIARTRSGGGQKIMRRPKKRSFPLVLETLNHRLIEWFGLEMT